MGLTEEQKKAIRERAAKRKGNIANEMPDKEIIQEEQPVVQNQGIQYSVPKMYCKYCGNIIDADSVVCSYCGNRVAMSQAIAGDQQQYQQQQYSQSAPQNQNVNNNPERVNDVKKTGHRKKPDPLLKLAGYLLGISVVGLLLHAGLTGSFSSVGKQKTEPKTTDNKVVNETVQNTDEQNNVSNTSSEPENSKDYYGVGETAVVNGVEFTLVDAGIVPEENYGYMKPEEGKVYFKCEFDIYNGSEKEITLSGLFGFDGYCDDYAISTTSDGYFMDDKDTLSGTIASGKRMSGAVYYEVPADFHKMEVVVSSSYWSNKTATFGYER